MKNKEKRKITVGTLIFIIAICGICLELSIIFRKEIASIFNTKIYRCVVVENYESSLLTYGSDGLNYAKIPKKGNTSYKKGQEILVYYDGMTYSTYPGSLSDVRRIKIIKENSDIKIPEHVFRYCYSSYENVSASIDEFSKDKILITIKDTNEYPYSYERHECIISKNYTNIYTFGGYDKISIENMDEHMLVLNIDWNYIYEKLAERTI